MTRPTLQGARQEAPSENLRQHRQTHKSRKRNPRKKKKKAANREPYEAEVIFCFVVMNLEIRLEESATALKDIRVHMRQ